MLSTHHTRIAMASISVFLCLSLSFSPDVLFFLFLFGCSDSSVVQKTTMELKVGQDPGVLRPHMCRAVQRWRP